MNLLLVSDIVEANGKTIKQNNLAQSHDIMLGTLVEINYESQYSDEASMKGVRMFVVNHSRDCDGTPLYDLSMDQNAEKEFEETKHAMEDSYGQERQLATLVHWMAKGKISRHWGRESLTVV